MVVDWDGTVRVCCNTWVKAGNLYESSAESIWSGAHFERFRHKMKANDYSWCIPDCPANANPSRLSLPNKYLYQLKSDPAQFARKVKQKIARSLASRRKVSQ